MSEFDDLLASFSQSAKIVDEAQPGHMAEMMLGVATIARQAGVDLGDPAQRRAVFFGVVTAPDAEDSKFTMLCVLDRIGAEMEGSS